MSAAAFTPEDLDWATRPHETGVAAMVRSILASIDNAMTESGCPLSGDQRALFLAAVRASRS